MMRNVIEGFENLTKQQLFDMAAAHVLKNGRPSMIGGACSYMGIGCAAAPFLTDSARKVLVGSWTGLVGDRKVPEHEEILIQRLQDCHDGFAGDKCHVQFITLYKRAMREVAKQFNLDPSILEKDHA